MFKIIIFSVLLACLFQGYQFVDRDDIIEEYKPQLVEREANFTALATRAAAETELLDAQIKNDTVTATTFANAQITTLKTTITTAKNVSADKPTVLSCIAEQETASTALNASSISTTCYDKVTYPALDEANSGLTILAIIPNKTLSACGDLDPLPSQDELFRHCISDKILDLDEQYHILGGNFDAVRSTVLTEAVNCLADQTAAIATEINQINFQVTLCISMG